MFPDVELVRNMQSELDIIIQEGVTNIVQLLRNADSGTSSSAAKVRNDDAFEDKFRMLRSFKDWDLKGTSVKQSSSKKERLTDRLLSEGLLTKKMMKDLRRELVQENKKSGKRK